MHVEAYQDREMLRRVVGFRLTRRECDELPAKLLQALDAVVLPTHVPPSALLRALLAVAEWLEANETPVDTQPKHYDTVQQ